MRRGDLIRWSAGREKRESKMQGSGVASLPHFEQISSIDPRHTPTDLRPPQSSKCPARSSSVKRRLSIIQRFLEFNFRSVPFTFSDVVVTSCTLRRIAGLAPSHLGLWRPPKIRSYVIFPVSQARIAPEVLPPLWDDAKIWSLWRFQYNAHATATVFASARLLQCAKLSTL